MLIRSDRTPIELGERVGTGGSGDVFLVVDQPRLVAKVHRSPQPNIVEIANAVDLLHGGAMDRGEEVPLLARPLGLLVPETSGRDPVVGFVMPAIDVASMTTLDQFLEHNARESLRTGLEVARRLAADVRWLHRAGFVIGDFSGTNTLIGPDLRPIWLDVDSFGFTGDGEVAAITSTQYTGGMTAPEVARLGPQGTATSIESDRFALAFAAGQLVLRGVPLYAPSKGGRPGSIQQLVNDGHCWLWEPENYHLPPGGEHRTAKCVPPSIERLLHGAIRPVVTDGSGRPSRPSAKKWERALDALVVTSCPNGHEKPGGAMCVLCDERPPSRSPTPPTSREPRPAPTGTPSPPPPTRPSDPPKTIGPFDQEDVIVVGILAAVAVALVVVGVVLQAWLGIWVISLGVPIAAAAALFKWAD